MSRPRFILNQAEEGEANLLINGEIDDWWGMGLREVSDQITNSGAKKINLQINSPGGSVTEGLAIAAFIKGFPAEINTTIIGLAASIATPIALAGDTVSMDRDSFFMIHNPWAMAGGEAEDLRETADLLDKMRDQLAQVYLQKISANKKLVNGRKDSTLKQIIQWMNNETWFTAQEAFDAGLVDKIVNEHKKIKRHREEDKETAKSILNKIKSFKNTPASFMNKVEEIAQTQIKNGANLGSFLSDAIDDMVTEEVSRADIIQEMADAAGISRDTTLGIIAGDVHCPPLDRLEGFAEVLDVTLNQIISAAEGDACEYVVDINQTKMAKTEESKTTFDEVKAFFMDLFKKEQPKEEAPAKEEVIEEVDEIAKAKAIAIENGFYKEPSKAEEPKEELNAEIQAKDEEIKKLKASLKKAELENAAPSAGDGGKVETTKKERISLENLVNDNKEVNKFFSAFAQKFNA